MSEISASNAFIGEETADVELDPLGLKSLLSKTSWKRFLKEGLFGLGEDYIDGKWEHPRLDLLLFEVIRNYGHLQNKWNPRLIAYHLSTLLFNHQFGKRAFEVGQKHYDLGNDLFTAMLDSSMSYTCGMWKNGSNLEEAQLYKLDLLCQRLKLQPGMRILDIGCGWGNFAHYAATHYGVSVVGLTISKEQAQYALKRCKNLPVEIRLEDFRNYSGVVDGVVSIEMIEAVGRKNIKTYFECVAKALKPGGMFALQVISGESLTLKSSPFLDQYTLWLVRHIFPNGYVPRMDEIAGQVVTGVGLRMTENENFGADYDQTLCAWHDNFEHHWPLLRDKYGERFRRVWQYYLCGCRAAFRSGLVDLWQVGYQKG